MDFSVTTVVAPKLATVMLKGAKIEKPKRRAKSRSLRTATRSGILKFPTISVSDSKDFRRPGMEQQWLERSRTMLRGSRGNAVPDAPQAQFARSRSSTKCSITLKGAPLAIAEAAD